MSQFDDMQFAAYLLDKYVAPEFVHAIVRELREDSDFKRQVPPNTYGAVMGRFVIRTDDVNLVENVCNAVEKAASVGFFVGVVSADALLSAKVSLALMVFKFARTFATRGVFLSDDELRIILAIRSSSQNAGLTEDEIAAAVGQDRLRVATQLSKLSQFPLSKGITRAFVEHVGERWTARV